MHPKLLQVCNVGRIVGGTAACAWTITRALPAFAHHVRFLSPPDSETAAVFSGCDISHRPQLTSADVADIRPDAILLHNAAQSRIVGAWSVPTLQYLHSAISNPATAHETIGCSRWLARQIGMREDRVLWQAAPKPASSLWIPDRKADIQNRLTVGRICTPQPRKWPRSVVPFYAELAERAPSVDWEFVGCPPELQTELKAACRNRARFHPAGWRQRSLLTRWDVLLYSNPSLPESFGRTVAEAMRAGCVPVVDRLGGFVEQVPAECGFLCERADEFAAALERLSDEKLRREMSHQARRHSNATFSLARFAEDLLRWLDRAAECGVRFQCA